MTLRQKYAKAAMQAMVGDPTGEPSIHQIATAAFAIADTMLMYEKQEELDMKKRRNQ